LENASVTQRMNFCPEGMVFKRPNRSM
jgi:hypothetical protein